MDTNAPPIQGTPNTGGTSRRPTKPLPTRRAPTAGSNAAPTPAPMSTYTAAPATGEYHDKKRKLDTNVFDFVNTQSSHELCMTHDDPVIANWTPSETTRDIRPTVLKILDHRAVMYQIRSNEASLLETPDGSVNFCTTDSHRLHVGGRLFKVFADRPSLDAMTSTLLNLAALGNAPFIHIRAEIEPARVGEKHRQQFAQMAEKAARQKAAEASAKADDVGEVNLGDGNRCVVCKKSGHTVQYCVMPNRNYGSVRFCPLCLTTAHDFDSCPLLKDKDLNNRNYIVEVTGLLLDNRLNRPQVRSARWPFYDLVALGIDLGFLKLPLDATIVWPWTNKFAKEVAAAKPGDEILQGKLHPSQFDYAQHQMSDLPVDPFVRNKTIAEILAMREAGEFDDDRFMPAAARKKAAAKKGPAPGLSEAQIRSLVREAMIFYNAVDENNQPIPRAHVDVAKFVIKQEEPDCDIETRDLPVRDTAAEKAVFAQVLAFYKEKDAVRDPNNKDLVYNILWHEEERAVRMADFRELPGRL